MSWDDGRVSIQGSVDAPHALSGQALRDGFVEAMSSITFGLARVRGNAIAAGPFELLRFGQPEVTGSSVEWPIDGGLLAGRPGGSWRVEVIDGRIEATLAGYTPSLPRPVYELTQLPVHRLFTRLYLLRLRGGDPKSVARPSGRDRFRAASVDVAFCLTLARLMGRRRRVGSTVAITATYHVACWSLFGRTLGGLVMRQRVVALDGSRLTPSQALFRFLLLPASWLSQKPVHDDFASTEVITG